jgi:hypothetical protein
MLAGHPRIAHKFRWMTKPIFDAYLLAFTAIGPNLTDADTVSLPFLALTESSDLRFVQASQEIVHPAQTRSHCRVFGC